MNLTKWLKGKATAASVAEKIAEDAAALRSMQEQHAERMGKREAVLLEGTDKDVDELDREIATGARTIERYEVGLAALKARLADLEKDERTAELNAIVESARKASDRGVERVDEYRSLVAAIAKVVAEIQACERDVEKSRSAAVELGVEKVLGPLARTGSTEEFPNWRYHASTIIAKAS